MKRFTDTIIQTVMNLGNEKYILNLYCKLVLLRTDQQSSVQVLTGHEAAIFLSLIATRDNALSICGRSSTERPSGPRFVQSYCKETLSTSPRFETCVLYIKAEI